MAVARCASEGLRRVQSRVDQAVFGVQRLGLWITGASYTGPPSSQRSLEQWAVIDHASFLLVDGESSLILGTVTMKNEEVERHIDV
jgi:hypothetical protein